MKAKRLVWQNGICQSGLAPVWRNHGTNETYETHGTFTRENANPMRHGRALGNGLAPVIVAAGVVSLIWQAAFAVSAPAPGDPAPSGAAAARPQTAQADAATSATQAAAKPFALPPAGQAPVIGEKEVAQVLQSHGARLLVANFWATWCEPCVKELPDFAAASKRFSGQGVRFVGFSLDFPEDAATRVAKFLQAKQIPYPNFVLDVDPNVLIPRFSAKWTGAIPATFLYDSQGRQVGGYLESLTADQLDAAIQRALPQAQGAASPASSPAASPVAAR